MAIRIRERMERFRKPVERQGLFGLRRVSQTDFGVELQYLSGLARVEAFRTGALRVRITRDLSWPDKISNAITARPEAECRLELKPDRVLLKTERLKLLIPEGPFRFEIYDCSDKLLSRDFPGLGPGFGMDDFSVSRFIFPDEEFFGLGDKYGGLSRKGKVWEFWNRDVGGKHFERDPRYTSVPFLISLRPGSVCGWFFDQPGYLELNLGKKFPGLMSANGAGGEMDLYFLSAGSVKELISLYTDLTGKAFLPPLWSLGYHQSRWSYFSQEEVEGVAEEFEQRQIPLSAVHLDIHYMDRYQPFTVDAKRFPDLAGLSRKLMEKGVRLVSIIDPGLKVDPEYQPYLLAKEQGYLCEDEQGEEYQRKLWPGLSAFPDFFRPEAREFWAVQHRGLFEQGISGIWNDMNEPSFWKYDLRIGKTVVSFRPEREPEMLHRFSGRELPHRECRNLYGQMECEATVSAFKKFRPGKRPFLLSRSGFAGIQRMSSVWTGDSKSRFRHLAGSITQILSLGLSGVSFAGADIGGFARDCPPELYARWIQLGSFYPFCRTHSSIRTRRQEPYQFGPEVEEIAKKYIRLRYRLMPTIYSLFWEASHTGVPVWRPLFLEFPRDFAARKIEDQFMVGPSLILAPIVNRGQKERRVYLPEGRWTDFWEKKEFSGPGWIKADAGLETMPIFIREGGILVFQQKPELKIPWPGLELEVYPGNQTGTFQLYQDDGESEEYLSGNFSTREFQVSKTNQGFNFYIGKKNGPFPIPERMAKVRFYGLSEKPTIRTDGRETENFFWNPDQNFLELEFLLDDREHLMEFTK